MNETEVKTIGILAFVGMLIGVGKILAKGGPVCYRVAIGRAVISGGLGLAAGSALVVFENLSLPALVGIAAAIVSLGTSALERVMQHLFPNRDGASNG